MSNNVSNDERPRIAENRTTGAAWTGSFPRTHEGKVRIVADPERGVSACRQKTMTERMLLPACM
jgi:hypothetical protein